MATDFSWQISLNMQQPLILVAEVLGLEEISACLSFKC